MRQRDVILVGFVLVGLSMRSSRRGARATAWRRWSDYDARTFVEQLEPLGVPLDALLKVYTAESGLDPRASSGIAWGLCQAIGSTLRSVGWSKPAREFGALTVAQQAPWVAKILASQIRMIGFTPTNALDLYVANFSPLAARNKSDVIYRKGSAAYDANQSLDAGKKGYIDRSDLARKLEQAESTAVFRDTLALCEQFTTRKLAQNG